MIVDDSNIIRRRIERSQQIARLEVVGRREQRARSRGTVSPHATRRRDHDLTMPEMDGVQCVQEWWRSIPRWLILVVSALADKQPQWMPSRRERTAFSANRSRIASSMTRWKSCLSEYDDQRSRNPHIHRGRDELLRGFGAAVGHRRIALSRDGRKTPAPTNTRASSNFGARKGIVYFTAPRGMLTVLLMRMQETDTSDENIKDLVGEVANTISGNARRDFGKNFVISVPVIIAHRSGQGHGAA